MKRAAVLAALVVGVFAPASRAGWSGAKAWDDGRAEVAVYDAERPIDGKLEPYRAEILISREDVDAGTLARVKDPKAQKTRRVFRMNEIDHFNAANFPIDSLVAVLAPSEAPEKPLQVTASLHDWNGPTFKRLAAGEDSATIVWHTLVDGDRSVDLPVQPGDLLNDQLPLALRTWPLKDGLRKEVRLWDTIANPHGIEPRVSTAVVTVDGEEIVRCRAGSLPSWKVVVSRPGITDSYWFEKAEPHLLTKMETADGRKRLLYGRARWSYWDKRLPRPNILN